MTDAMAAVLHKLQPALRISDAARTASRLD